jgi:serine/threonine-protein kinase
MAAGLERAHAAGIVHRDLKPGNVMLLPDGTVKILDFGLAKARNQSLTESGMLLGTVSYMAPEQIRGETIDGRADLWALGVVLYEMLTQRTPFESEQDIAVAHAILHNEPVPPSTHRSDVSPASEDLVLRLLEKDPARRYPTATALLSELAHVRTVTVGPRDSLRRRLHHVSRMLSRNKRRMLMAGAAIVLIGAGGLSAIVRKSATPVVVNPRTAIAVLPFRNLSAEGPNAYFASGLHEEIISQLYKVPAVKVIGRNSVMSYAGANAPPIQQIARELRVGTIVDASVQVVGNRVRVNVQLVDALTEAPLWVERYDRTLEDAFALQSDIAQQIVATVGAALSSVERSAMAQVPTTKAQAYLLYLRGREYDRRPGGVIWNLDSAMALYEQALALDSSFALAHAALSSDDAEMYWRRYDMTPRRLARQRARAEAALRLAPDLADAHLAMARVYNTGPETDRSEYRKHIEMAQRTAPNDARVWRSMAEVHRRLGQWDEYVAALEKAAESDPRDAGLLEDGGFTLRRMGRHADAIRWYNRALSVRPTDEAHAATQLQKGWTFTEWQGQLDTLRAAMSGASGQRFLSYGWIHNHCHFLLVTRQADSLLKLLKWARDEAPHVGVVGSALEFTPYGLLSGWAHQVRGDSAAARAGFDSALVFLDSAITRFPEDQRSGRASIPSYPVHQARGMALARLGRRDEALREVRFLRESSVYRNDHFLGPYVRIGAAQILAHAGEANAAMDELERMLANPAPAITVHTLRLEPVWDPLREQSRFRALLAKYGS